ncbi:MAG: hypothetical protein H2054_01725 [Sphingomonas sp.]|uniref:hypothetical protein n=1 Tax=Sphingomonas sp. TaxID=28214 RepID=UPI000DAFBE7B|nr:hypothetical protein [Zymomonas sp.]MBA4771812.1 hypothetical protein [Sphingomonas sp.]PZP19867.1 MAG: hypothetical protein DI607_01350 [Sphingomonas hengshuiensis]
MIQVIELLSGFMPWVLLLICVIQVLRLAHATLLHLTLRKAISVDAPIARDLVDKIDQRMERQGELPGDDRNGLVLIALGLAIAGFGLIQQDGTLRSMLGAALFPLFVGIALLIRRWLVERAIASETATGE